MFGLKTECSIVDEEYHSLEEYEGSASRWCPGCGDNGILTALQRLCRDEQLPPEKTVFVSGIGCAARLPHYVSTYGFHGLHGRALPTAAGIKIRRPDLNVFVNMGDGDCCSIGTAHWIHTTRLNMNMLVCLHDNGIYGLTKKQVSPTTPIGTKTNTTPDGAMLHPLNPLTVTLGITNASFVAQVVEWAPELLYDLIQQGFHHKGFAFIRILQRCPHFMPGGYESILSNPENALILRDEKKGMNVSDTMSKFYKNQIEHDPADLNRARELAQMGDQVPIGILYRDERVPRYEEVRKPAKMPTAEQRESVLSRAFDKFGIVPQKSEGSDVGKQQ